MEQCQLQHLGEGDYNMPGVQFSSAGKRFKEVACTFLIYFSSQSNDKVAWRIIEQTVLSAVLWSANMDA